MKNLKTLAAIAALILLGQVILPAQGIGVVAPSGVSHKPVTTNTAAILVPGSTTTNIPVGAAYMLPSVGTFGFGIYARFGGTNSADTTNAVLVFEGVIFPSTGVTQVVDNATITVSTPTTVAALATGYDYYTNIQNTAANVLNVDAWRLRSIQNTNLGSLWVSNLFQTRYPSP